MIDLDLKRHNFTRSTLLGGLALIALAATSPAAASKPKNSSAKADLILTDAVVIPMTSPDAKSQAVAVRAGRIMAVGSEAEIAALRGPSTKVVDLDGKTVLPGFIDAHGHISGVAQLAATASLQPPPVGKTSSIASLQQQLRDHAAKTPGSWIVGFGYDDAQLTEHRHPTRQELDAVSADRPIIIVHTSGHLGVLNTIALEMAGMLHPKADPPGGVIAREADGTTASGLLEETAIQQAMALIPKPNLDQSIALLGMAQNIYASYGLTTAQDGGLMPDYWPVLQEAARRKTLKIDIHALPLIAEKWTALETLPFGKPYVDHLRVAGVKIVLDGSPQGRTAWLSQPYFHAPEDKPKDYAGYPRYNDAQLDGYLSTAARNGWQVFVHVNGDAAIQQLIDGVRTTNAQLGKPMQRTIAIHAQTARSDQLKAMKELDIEPSFFASHTYYWGDWHREQVLGAERADHISPQREAFDLGLRPSIHNDSPVVPPDMIRLVWSAVTRRTRSSDILGPAERVTTYEALEEVTRNAAYQLHEEQAKGTLEPGKLADFVVLSANPLAMPGERLLDLRISMTIKEGVVVWQASPASPSQN